MKIKRVVCNVETPDVKKAHSFYRDGRPYADRRGPRHRHRPDAAVKP
jgi:hypothetical protein